MENPMNKRMIWGVFPLFLETPICWKIGSKGVSYADDGRGWIVVFFLQGCSAEFWPLNNQNTFEQELYCHWEYITVSKK